MSSNFTVIYDACVLYPAPLRDLLMRLALTDLYRARWTDMIHDEWTRNVLKQRPDLKAEDLERTRSLMNAHVRDSLVTEFEHLIVKGFSIFPTRGNLNFPTRLGTVVVV